MHRLIGRGFDAALIEDFGRAGRIGELHSLLAGGAARLKLGDDLLPSGMSVSKEHARISMTADQRDLRDCQVLLEEPADGFVPEIMKAQFVYSGSPL